MLIECADCSARDVHCEDCVVTALLGGPDLAFSGLQAPERAALVVLADSGLVAPLRLVSEVARPA